VIVFQRVTAFFLMVFVMVYHLHTSLTNPMPSSQMKQHHKILKSLLNTLMHNLKTNFDMSVNITDFIDLRLFVCGGAVGKKDAEPDAFSLLIKQDSTINDRL
jgi:hypothetical protein